MTRYVLQEVTADGPPREVVTGSPVQVLLELWERLVPVELMGQLRLHDLPAGQRRAADRLRAEFEALAPAG